MTDDSFSTINTSTTESLSSFGYSPPESPSNNSSLSTDDGLHLRKQTLTGLARSDCHSMHEYLNSSSSDENDSYYDKDDNDYYIDSEVGLPTLTKTTKRFSKRAHKKYNNKKKNKTMLLEIASSFRFFGLFFVCMMTVTLQQLLLHATDFSNTCCSLGMNNDNSTLVSRPPPPSPPAVIVNTSYTKPDGTGRVDLQATARVWSQISFSAEYDQALLPHTVQHYLNLGLDPRYMLIVLHHTQEDAPGLRMAHRLLTTRFRISHVRTWHGNFTSEQNFAEKLEQRAAAGVDDCDWMIKLDSDELLRVPGNDLISFLQGLSVQNFDQVSSHWVDRVGPHGRIPDIRPQPSLSEQFPVGCQSFSANAGADAKSFKVFAFRGYLQEKRSGHSLDRPSRYNSCRYPVRLVMDHFKWSAPVVSKLRRRMEHYKSLNISWWVESEAFLQKIDNHGGAIDIHDADYGCTDYLADAPAGEDAKSRLSRLPFVHSFLPQMDVIKEKTKEMVDSVDICNRPPQCPSKLARRRP
mmetsp:Transcript_13686/g.37832  ORF Transcript_13686/g.37832 Transcript_13686/m.37832 type:complete len:521 (-) Transcript_13686:442-2004(-)